MKKKLLLVAMFAFLFVGLVACGNDDSGAPDEDPAPASEGPTGTGEELGEIVVVTPAAEHGWMAGVIYFAEQAGADIENFRILTSSDVAEQAGQLDELISQGVGAIVLQPHTYELEVAADRVIEAGIPLIVFNRYVNVDYDAYVAGSNLQMGEESARKIGEGLDGEGIVITVANPSAGSTSAVRNEGFANIMDEYFPNIERIEMTVENFTQEAALSSMADVLVANPHIDAIFSIDDETSLGILQAIREAGGRDDIQFISGGGGAQTYFQEIYNEEAMTLFSATYSPRMMGDAIRTALTILQGGTPALDADNQWIIPPTIITRDNASNYFDADSPY